VAASRIYYERARIWSYPPHQPLARWRLRLQDRPDARAGDKLVLGKPLGVGIYSAALKNRVLEADGYKAMIASTTQLNTPGPRLAQLEGVHALTDVTGVGLLGHLLEVCKGSKLDRRLGA
jgi:selenide,water dikinase